MRPNARAMKSVVKAITLSHAFAALSITFAATRAALAAATFFMNLKMVAVQQITLLALIATQYQQ